MACERASFPTYNASGQLVSLDAYKNTTGDSVCNVSLLLLPYLLLFQLVCFALPIMACCGLPSDPLMAAMIFSFGALCRLLSDHEQTPPRRRAIVDGIAMLGPLWHEVLGLRMATFKWHVSSLVLSETNLQVFSMHLPVQLLLYGPSKLWSTRPCEVAHKRLVLSLDQQATTSAQEDSLRRHGSPPFNSTLFRLLELRFVRRRLRERLADTGDETLQSVLALIDVQRTRRFPKDLVVDENTYVPKGSAVERKDIPAWVLAACPNYDFR